MNRRLELRIVLFLAWLFVVVPPVYGAKPTADPRPLFRCTDPSGTVTFTTQASPGCVVLLVYTPKGDKKYRKTLPDAGVARVGGWVLVASGEDAEARVYESRTNRLGSLIDVWLMFRYYEPKVAGGRLYRKLIAKTQLNCTAGTMWTTDASVYDTSSVVGGRLVADIGSEPEQSPPPDSFGDQIIQKICARPSG